MNTFCEQHGPQILICTYLAKKYVENKDKEIQTSNGRMIIEESSEEEDYMFDMNKDPKKMNKNLNFSEKMRVLFPTNNKIESPPQSSCQDCSTCKSVEIGKGFITMDPHEPKYIITSRYPDPLIYSKIKRAGLKSLSCEICPNKEGVIIFGDEKEGFVLSYIFKILDLNSRGGLRFFSFVASFQDKVTLINYYHLFVRNFVKIANEIQEQANINFEKEKENQKVNPSSSVLLKPNNFQSSSKSDSLLSQNQKRSLILKPLVNLVNHNDLFFKLHISFCNLIFLTKKRELCEDKQKIQKKHSSYHKLIPKRNVIKNPYFNSFHQLFDEFGESYKNLLYHLLIGSQIILRGKNLKLNKAILSFFQYLLPTKQNTMYFCDNYNSEISTVNLISLPENSNIPKEENIFIIDVNEENDKKSFICWYNKTVPENTKLPSLFTSLDKVFQTKSEIEIEFIQIESITEEWLNKVKVFL
eukprot:TRINITY_DN390_c0_g1_i1.p1 TRINITY_DN390_c0_g1~~TRINITY_DN390_c0_g1_i1.p1  ORF type:complete len:493 (-),score=116.39 TRINITY_DN390_c0_g1_i1:177-1586(-)